VKPGVPAFLPDLPAGARPDRSGLAQWLFGAENPLTARVTVNRMWQELFGTGLVATTGDFGVVGASAEQRIDYLANLLLSRPAGPVVRQVLAESLERFRADYADTQHARDLLSVGDSPADATAAPGELAAWTMAASLLMNTDEALNK